MGDIISNYVHEKYISAEVSKKENTFDAPGSLVLEYGKYYLNIE